MQRITKTKKVATVAPRIVSSSKQQSVADKSESHSTQSWSPTIDVFSKPEEPVVKRPNIPTKNSSSAEIALVKDEPRDTYVSRVSAPPIPEPNLERRNKISEELSRKSRDYEILEKWIDSRLSIFLQLQKDLATAMGNKSATDRITNRVVIETKNLEADKEYKWKRIELDQLQKKISALQNDLQKLSQ